MNIVTAIKNGDHLVFRQVFNEYHEKVYFFIYKKAKSQYLAEEVAQLTFFKLWNFRHTLNENYTISTQIFRIAITTLIDLLRKQHTNLAVIKEIANNQEYINLSFNNKLDEKELIQKYNLVLKDMPEVQRRVFEMSRKDGLSYKQIAETLNVSVRTVEVHISRALKRFRKVFPLFFLVITLLFFLDVRVNYHLIVLLIIK